ncbi:site-specific DNA-methyltransferase [Dermacoccaceae bacterium W4C1]
MTSLDLAAANMEAIASLFPSVMVESVDAEGNGVRAVDFDLLRQELSGHLVEGPQERYHLDWPGKRAAAFAANSPIAKTLRPLRPESVDFDTTENLIIEGDNLEALKLIQESYLGKVDLIFIDPPYNTGNDFVYEDDFIERRGSYLDRSGQIDAVGGRLIANLETSGRFHSTWLSMMYARLRLARTLLRPDGIMMITIGDAEQANLVRIVGELFGAQNIIGQFIWKKKAGGGGKQGKNDPGKQATKNEAFVIDHDYVLCVVRERAVLDRFNVPLTPDETKGYLNEDDDPRGPYKLKDLEQSIPTSISTLYYPLFDPDGVELRPKGGRFQWRRSQDRVIREFAEGQIIWKKVRSSDDPRGYKYRPMAKQYLHDPESGERTKSARSLLLDHGLTRDGAAELRDLFAAEAPFDFPKPVRLVQSLIEMAARPDALVLDFFAGSGTTAHAVIEQNAIDGGSRRFILVQLDEKVPERSQAAAMGFRTIADVTRERVRRAGAAVRESFPLSSDRLDPGFRALKVASTNMNHVLRTPDETDQEELVSLQHSIKQGRSGEDLLFQVLLDWGLELTLPISANHVDGREVFVVDDGALVACFDDHVSHELVRALARQQPLRAVFRVSGFASDDARINAEQIFKELSPATEVKAI